MGLPEAGFCKRTNVYVGVVTLIVFCVASIVTVGFVVTSW
jgi:hypothetical protein